MKCNAVLRITKLLKLIHVRWLFDGTMPVRNAGLMVTVQVSTTPLKHFYSIYFWDYFGFILAGGRQTGRQTPGYKYIYLTKLGNGIIILPIPSPNCFRIRKKLGNFPNFVKYILSPQGLGAFPHSNLKNDIFRTHSYAHIQGRDDILSSDIYRGKYIS